MGRIGRAIVQRSTGFDGAARHHTCRLAADVAWPHEPSLLGLARWADVRVLVAAGLDGFENEPQVPAERMALDNPVLPPPWACGAGEARQALADRVFDHLQRCLATGRLVSAAPAA